MFERTEGATAQPGTGTHGSLASVALATRTASLSTLTMVGKQEFGKSWYLKRAELCSNVFAVSTTVPLAMLLGALMWSCTPKFLTPFRKALAFNLLVNVFHMSCQFPYVYHFMANTELGNMYFQVSSLSGGMSVEVFTIYASVRYFATYLLLAAAPVPCVFRYFLVCRNIKLSTGFSIIVFVAILGTVPIGIVWAYIFWPNPVVLEQLSRHFVNTFWMTENGKMPLFVAAKIDGPFIITIPVFTVIAYSAILFCTLAVYKHLQTSRAQLSQSSIRDQNELSFVLAAQALGPLVFSVAPLLLSQILVKLETHNDLSSTLYPLLGCWTPTVNVASMLFLVKPYRLAVVHFFRSFCVKEQTVYVIPSVAGNGGLPVAKTR